MRKKAVGLLGNLQGERRPIPFVEDTVVPPEVLADYVKEFRALLDGRGLSYGMFGHVDAGVLHIRPALDMKDPDQEKLIRALTDEVVALTSRYGGLLWGEHGKGLRSEYAPAVFGPLYPVLQAVKSAFDPGNRLNPGKIATPGGAGALLKIDEAPTRGAADRQIPLEARASFESALHCNGNGACFNFEADDAMCPSWKATRDRRHSPKGRAALMREWLRLLAQAGSDPLSESRALRVANGWKSLPARIGATIAAWRGATDFSREVKEAMDGCLACKACVGQCPIKVDVPGFRATFLELYHGRYLRPPKDYLVLALEQMLPSLSRIPRLYNGVIASRLGRALLRLFGLVETPKLSRLRLGAALRDIGVQFAQPEALAGLTDDERANSVVLVQDAFTSFFETELVIDVLTFLRRLGFTPWIAPFMPNGKPMHVQGFLRRFKATARANAAMLRRLSEMGVALVGLDPSMTLTYRAEYSRALDGEAIPPVLLLQEWLAPALERRKRPTLSMPHYALLPHCTERTNAPAGTEAWARLFRALGAELTILPSGCCGMAGTYGHEAANRERSVRIYASSWKAHVADPVHAGRLVATGYSCRCQARLIDGVMLPHPAQALLRALP
jgi:Fe-S oxidoreductase